MPTHRQTDEHDTHTDKCMHRSITHTLTHTHTGTHTHRHSHASGPPATPRPHTHTQARARTHAREPRTPTPARGRSATAARPRRRLHPALPRQLAGAAALPHAASPTFRRFGLFVLAVLATRTLSLLPIIISPRKPLLPGIAFLWRVKDPQDLSLLTMRTRYTLLSCAVLVLHLVKSAAANAGGLSFGALSHHRIEWPCACPSLSLSP